MQYPFGTTEHMQFPKGITPSGALPVTSTPMPASLRRVPSGISRAIRIGDLWTDPNPDDSFFRTFSDAASRIARIAAAADPRVPNPYYGYPGAYPPSTFSTFNWTPVVLVAVGLIAVLALTRR